MNANSSSGGSEKARHGWTWFLVMGIIVMILGLIALGDTKAAALFGLMLLLSGCAHVIELFGVGGWRAFKLDLMACVLDVAAGILILSHLHVTAALTLLMVGYFLTLGVFRIIGASGSHLPLSGWTVLNGAVALLLGIGLWAHWPLAGDAMIGLCVGIELLFRGWAWIMTSVGAHKQTATDAVPQAA